MLRCTDVLRCMEGDGVADEIATEKVAYSKPAITNVGSLVDLTAADLKNGDYFDGVGYQSVTTPGAS